MNQAPIQQKKKLDEFVYKVLHKIAAPIDSLFFDKQTSPYNICANDQLVQPVFNTMQYGKVYGGSSLWNFLPHVKCPESHAVLRAVFRRNGYKNICECGTCMLCLRNSLKKSVHLRVLLEI